MYSAMVRHPVLIVPYGIETGILTQERLDGDIVLIVPYGIETRKLR